ncbi:MAG: DUF502 domain-containing protein [Verrucomicrobia bacterium]|nr:DUF502 domain-containing protein [Verrucomicrobiota bacterium]
MSDVPPPTSRIASIRNAFFTGALLLAPLVVTLWALGRIIDIVGGTFRPFFESYLPDSLQGLPLIWDLVATLVIFALVTALGFLSHYVFGRVFLRLIERSILTIPGVNAVYNSVRQIVATFGSKNRNLYNKVVLVQFPRAGTWTLGFLTNKAQSEAQIKAGVGELWTVFVPTTPNPTGGYLLMFPPHEVIELEMSVGDGMKMIISGGAVVPPWSEKKPAPVVPPIR